MIHDVHSSRVRLIGFALIFCVALLWGARFARAQQTPEEARSILTVGTWEVHKHGSRHFHDDGTMTSDTKEDRGTWRIDGSELDIKDSSGLEWRYPLPIDPNGTKGVSVQTKRANTLIRVNTNQDDNADAGAEASSTPPVSAAVQAQASAVIQAHHDSLVFVTGSAGAGSGFIVKMGSGGNFLVTNVHVTADIRDAAFKSFDGQVVKTGAPSMAVGEDVFCMSMPDGGTPFEMMTNVGQDAAVGDDVVVLGNAEGGGVINTITGKIVGIGPNLVEVDAPFVPGNSGSPIVHLKTGKVIGVATYTVTNQYDLTTNKKLAKPVIRRFGYRIDNVKGWQAVNWPSFYAQAEEMERFDGLTDDLYNFINDLAENQKNALDNASANPLIKQQIDRWLAGRGSHPSAEDAAEADSQFLAGLKLTCQQGIPQAQQQITYDYFRRDLHDQIQGRNELAGDFQQIIKNIEQ